MVYDNERAKRDAIRNMSMQGNRHVPMNPASARQAAHPGQPAGGNLKRAHAEAAMSALNQEALLKKKRRTAELKSELDPAALPLELLRVVTDAEIEAQEKSCRYFRLRKHMCGFDGLCGAVVVKVQYRDSNHF
ncbi:hypothetical protein K7X08_035004 [Anisodus acutangulus]|uniref:Uncharacterized protein n=1 Tax=Anisodus acutangulus TaxID=402998 RepID=A0A9Q1LK68_9SOLA|nr:hypothetical protein K7X08_035004 [Anisodus acutangulus]